ncbi:MAG: tetratricopeptide repeat protein [Dysgonamonadaceae bacterium]|jgi:tetratricopeptide (TPR) repeat protein|nr:tetratricopeptide repeat protein [Dysgonamonadaceae bacterium]
MRISTLILLLFSIPALAQTFEQQLDSFYLCLDRQRPDSAEIVLKALLRNDPANPLNPMLLSNLGAVQRQQGKLDDALVSYTAALGHAPRSVTLLTNRAELFTEMDSPENALTDYTAVLLIDSLHEDARYRRGLLYLRIKNYEAAQQDFERLLVQNPQSYAARNGLASLYKLEGRLSEAETLYIYLTDHYPDLPDVYAGRAELYILMNRPAKALSDINRAIRLQEANNPPNPYYYGIRSRIKAMQYEKNAAAEDAAKARY